MTLKPILLATGGDMTDMAKDKATEMGKDQATDAAKKIVK